MTDDTLQTDDESAVKPESAPGEEIEEGVTLPDDQEQEQEPGTDDKDPERFNKRYNTLYREKMDEKRRADAAEAKAEELKKQLPTEQRPVIPPVPDPYDADYAEDLKVYTKAVADAATYDAEQRAIHERQQADAEEAQRKQVGEVITKAQGYTERAAKVGIDPQTLQVAGNTVQQYGIHDDLAGDILEDEKGPTITLYLAQHPEDLAEMSRMSLTRAAVHLETVVKPKAIASSGISGAPEPPETLGGGGAPPAQRGPKGATFE